MGQILHVSATSTEAVRRALQNSQESLRALSKHYGINQKTVAKWKRRTPVQDLPIIMSDIASREDLLWSCRKGPVWTQCRSSQPITAQSYRLLFSSKHGC